jgi:tRNA-2-methylthio-N6-dimethylallyladenosine synthase
VPAQSGCNEVLKRMKRQYTVEFYLDMLARCREIVPHVAISSDFIVGFCGETEESFERSCDLVRAGDFKNSYIFKYSTRPGTKGHELFADDIPEEVKKRRNNDLLAIQNAMSLQNHLKHIGRRERVLVEGLSKNGLKHEGSGPTQLTGRTMSDHIVVFDGNPRLVGQTVSIDIVEATSFTLFGEVVTDEKIGVDGEEQTGDSSLGEEKRYATRRIGLPVV